MQDANLHSSWSPRLSPKSPDRLYFRATTVIFRRRHLYLIFGMLATSVFLFSIYSSGTPFYEHPSVTVGSKLSSQNKVDDGILPNIDDNTPAPSDNNSATNSPAIFSETTVSSLGPAGYLLGPPTARFRDNLRPEVKYISSWVAAGWTNDVMTYINLIYLALITERVPIIPMFTPSHLGNVPPIDFGEVFDVPRLRKALGHPVLEWHEVKNRSSEEVDDIGCWSVWEAVQEREQHPRGSPVPDHLKLDISYTKAPTWINLIPRYEHDQHATFSNLASLAFPETRNTNLVTPRASRQHQALLPPDEHMLCYDYLYYVCSNQPNEFEFDYSPAWRFVGRHLHFTPRLMDLADQYVRRAFGTQVGEPTPLFVSIHVRHLDFGVYCGERPLTECFASLPVIARRVEEVKQEIWRTKRISVDHVVMTSDERNATWWADVAAQGWFGVDHTQTKELYGPWYAVLIDATIQASGTGFVGTDRSTMSTIARRRVQSWQGGAVRTVKWGRPDSDNH